MDPPEPESAKGGPARRVAAALRALTGRGPRTSSLLVGPRTDETRSVDHLEPVAAEPDPDSAQAHLSAPPSPDPEDAAARIEAARERLRATIAPPEDPAEEPDEAPRKRGP